MLSTSDIIIFTSTIMGIVFLGLRGKFMWYGKL